MANCVKASPDHRSMQQGPKSYCRCNEKQHLCGQESAYVSLPEKEELHWEIRVVSRARCDRLGQASKERIGPKRNDQSRYTQTGYQDPVDCASNEANEQCNCECHSNGQTCVMPQRAKGHCTQAHHGSDRKIDAARHDDRSKRECQ